MSARLVFDTARLWALIDDLHVAMAFDRTHAIVPALEQLAETLEHLEARYRAVAVEQLGASCTCGRDRGDHLVDAPHGSDPHEEPLPVDDEGTLLPACTGFRPIAPVRVLELVRGDTEAPAHAAVTVAP